MKSAKSTYDFHPEFIIQRYCNGVKLVKPNKMERGPTIGDFLNMPFNVYFLNKESAIQVINEQTAKAFGFGSCKEVLGKTVVDIYGNSDDMCALVANDKIAIHDKKTVLVEEMTPLKEIIYCGFLSIKFPFYDNKNQVIGVFGCSFPLDLLGKTSLSSFLNTLMQAKLLNYSEPVPGIKIEGCYFSGREKEILANIVRGKTAKEIGDRLTLSVRTIERHIENIKLKTGIRKKSHLIEKFFSQFSK